MATVTFLLPSPARLGGTLPPMLATALGRADRLPNAESGERAQMLRHFQLDPRGWPVAALTREVDAGDAGEWMWLRADPAWLRADINGARLFACGEGLQLATADVDALLPSLQPLFSQAGFPIDAPVPSHWYLRLPRGAVLPVFADPTEALGADAFDYFPRDGSAAARTWAGLLNEAQIVLHNHPWNARRAAAGKPAINSLWFWGAGALPDRVTAAVLCVQSDESILRSLATASAVPLCSLTTRFELPHAHTLIDLRATRDIQTLARDWLEPAVDALGRGKITGLRLDGIDGDGFQLDRTQRWRVWRQPLKTFVLLRPPAPTDEAPVC